MITPLVIVTMLGLKEIMTRLMELMAIFAVLLVAVTSAQSQLDSQAAIILRSYKRDWQQQQQKQKLRQEWQKILSGRNGKVFSM